MACSKCLRISGPDEVHKHNFQLSFTVHPACTILACYKSKQSIKDSLPKLAKLLREENLIAETMVLPPNARDGSNQILSKIQEAVCSDHQNLKKFASVLLKFAATREFGEAMIDDYHKKFPAIDIDSAVTVTEKQKNEVHVRMNYIVIAEIRSKFVETLSNVCEAMSDVPYEKLKLYLRCGYPYLATQLEQCKGKNEILSIISGESSLTDVNLLEAVADQFNIEDAKVAIKEYKDKVNDFFINMPLSHCLVKLLSLRDSSVLHEMVTIFLECNTDSCTIDDAKALISECASQHLVNFKILVVNSYD